MFCTWTQLRVMLDFIPETTWWQELDLQVSYLFISGFPHSIASPAVF